jgi:hypothetical protein
VEHHQAADDAVRAGSAKPAGQTTLVASTSPSVVTTGSQWRSLFTDFRHGAFRLTIRSFCAGEGHE